MTSGDLNIGLTEKKKLFTKCVGLSTIYQTPFAVCRRGGGRKGPGPIPNLSEPPGIGLKV